MLQLWKCPGSSLFGDGFFGWASKIDRSRGPDVQLANYSVVNISLSEISLTQFNIARTQLNLNEHRRNQTNWTEINPFLTPLNIFTFTPLSLHDQRIMSLSLSFLYLYYHFYCSIFYPSCSLGIKHYKRTAPRPKLFQRGDYRQEIIFKKSVVVSSRNEDVFW